MANILLLSNIYPLKDAKLYGSTSVCEYFTKEWKDMGHNVKVVYNYTTYPYILHYVAKSFGTIIGNVFPTVINSEYFKDSFEYEKDGISVLLNPVFKLCPKLQFSEESISKNVNRTINWIKSTNFHPDLIIGHFLHPNIQILPILGKIFNCKTTIVLHGKYNNKRDSSLMKRNFSLIDYYGFRSFPIRKSFTQFIEHTSSRNQFMCFSGIPENFLDAFSWEKHSFSPPQKILFVGNLISRKYPMTVLEAFYSVFKDKGELTVVGSGQQELKMKNYVNAHKLEDKVHFLGRLERKDVRNMMQQNEIFTMISKDETFGLVYLEAMACGCIVIASKNEGMDGIIENGVNGFLCEAGNKQELAKIYYLLSQMDGASRREIARRGVETANSMTDRAMARAYLYSMIEERKN